MLATNEESDTFVMFLGDKESGWVVPIGIGPTEATSILLAMEGKRFPRPLSHDLLQNILQGLGAELERVVIDSIKEDAFCATLSVRSSRKGLLEIDARPSDSVALALRMGTPLYIAEPLFKEAAVELPSGETSQFDEFIDSEMNLTEFWHRKDEEGQ